MKCPPFLIAILVYTTSLFANEFKSIKKYGVGINLGVETGGAIGGFYNLDKTYQIRFSFGSQTDHQNWDININGLQQPYRLGIDMSSVISHIGARYYVFENWFMESSIGLFQETYSYSINIDSLSMNIDREAKEFTFGIPIKIGGEIARYSSFSGYIYGGYLIYLNNGDEKIKVHPGDTVYFVHDGNKFIFGLGVSFNWKNILKEK